ncbi:MAG: DUF4139 domain-containing protein [Deltaproteobacteria bacterium]|nr:DUF4139 domain-containing protein [Candidatus Tharpella aukensis]
MLRKLICILGVVLLLAVLTTTGVPALAAQSAEVVTTLNDQVGVAVTIYNENLALVKDKRRLSLEKGEVKLAFREVSARMRPETALLTAAGLSVIEQNFEFDLLTPQALLKKYVGRQVEVITRHPTTGVESRRPAKVLSSNSGVVLQFDDHIETGVPGRLSFSELPGNLRDRPTLTMLMGNSKAGAKDIELSYLTGGLRWQADYVAELNATDDAINLSGWVTLTNTSGASYQNAKLQLVAGDVHQAPPEQAFDGGVRREMMMKTMAAPAQNMAQEEMFEYHLYTLARPTTIADNQSKQVALLQAAAVPCKKEFLLKGNSYYYRRVYGEIDRKLKVGVFVEIENRKKNHLGLPLPKGVVRVYKEDSKGALQFIGEDRIDHTPENETIRLKLGDAFDLTAAKKQTDFKKIGGDGRYNYIYEASFEVKLKNAKSEAVEIKLVEPIPGDWEILTESHSHHKDNSSAASWRIPVPAKGESTLVYRVRVKY